MPAHLSRGAIARIAEQRIQAAIDAGDFDGLPGLGRPIPSIDEPYDPMWWVNAWKKRLDKEDGPLPSLHATVASLSRERGAR